MFFHVVCFYNLKTSKAMVCDIILEYYGKVVLEPNKKHGIKSQKRRVDGEIQTVRLCQRRCDNSVAFLNHLLLWHRKFQIGVHCCRSYHHNFQNKNANVIGFATSMKLLVIPG